MKKIIVFVLCLNIFFTLSGCDEKDSSEKTKDIQKPVVVKTTKQKNPYNIVINEEDPLNKTSTFYLGMTFKETVDKIKELGIKQTSWTVQNDSVILIMDENISLDFGFELSNTDEEKQKAKIIAISSDSLPTNLGIKGGDSIEKMKKCYGTNYSSYLDPNTNYTIYKYKRKDYVFSIECQENKNVIMSWGITTLSN